MDDLTLIYQSYADGKTNIHSVIAELNSYICEYKWFGTDTDKPEPVDIFTAKAMLVRFTNMLSS